MNYLLPRDVRLLSDPSTEDTTDAPAGYPLVHADDVGEVDRWSRWLKHPPRRPVAEHTQTHTESEERIEGGERERI